MNDNFTLDNFEDFANFVVEKLSSLENRFDNLENRFDNFEDKFNKHAEAQERFERSVLESFDKVFEEIDKSNNNKD